MNFTNDVASLRSRLLTSRIFAMLLPLALFAMAGPAAAAPVQGEVCTQVTVKFSQQLVLTRTVFEATLTMGNDTNSLVEDVELEFDVRDANGLDSYGLFQIGAPQIEPGFTGVGSGGPSTPLSDELGNLLPQSEGTAVWTLLAEDEATPGGVTTEYLIGGSLRYVTNGSPISIPLVAVPITVEPDAELVLTYTLPDFVWSDNPFSTAVIEPSEPFALHLEVENTGFGTARNVTVEAEQPEIVENVSLLAISFALVDAQVGCDPVQAPEYQLELGDIGPGETRVVRWLVTGSLVGEFLTEDCELTITQTGPLSEFEGAGLLDVEGSSCQGGLVHTVKLGRFASDPIADDTLPDLLRDEDPSDNPIDSATGQPALEIPSVVESSDGSTEPVFALLGLVPEAAPTTGDLATGFDVQLNSMGWKYLQFDNLGGEAYDLAMVSRTGPDFQRLSYTIGGPGDVSEVWTHVRSLDIGGTSVPDVVLFRGHIFTYVDVPGTYRFDLVYQPAEDAVLVSDIDLISASAGGVQNLTFTAGPQYAGEPYLFGGGLAIAAPGEGLVLDGLELPFTPNDNYLSVVIANLTSPTYTGFFGVLDGGGSAQASLNIVGGFPPAFVGRRYYHAAIVLDSNLLQFVFVSNPVAATLIL